jgi:DNA-binding response OmpR family regulator
MTKNPINILLIEDNDNDALYIQEILSEIKTMSFQFNWVTLLSEGIAHLKKGGVDLVLLDLSLPDSKKTQTVSNLKKEIPDIPTIVLTSLDDEETGVKAIKEGAQDYIVKRHITNYTLRLSIRYAIERQKLIANIKQLKGLLPICSKCKKIRNDKGYWQKVEVYIRQHSAADFSHSLCPDCVKVLYPEFSEAEAIKNKKSG